MTFTQSVTNHFHYRENLRCGVIGDFYFDLVYMQDAKKLFSDLVAFAHHVNNENIPQFIKIHADWLASFDCDGASWMRLCRHAKSNYFIVIVGAGAVGFMRNFKK